MPKIIQIATGIAKMWTAKHRGLRFLDHAVQYWRKIVIDIGEFLESKRKQILRFLHKSFRHAPLTFKLISPNRFIL